MILHKRILFSTLLVAASPLSAWGRIGDSSHPFRNLQDATTPRQPFGCIFGSLLKQGDVLTTGQTRSNGSRTVFLEQSASGALEIYEGQPAGRGRLMWKSEPFRTVEGAGYETFVQGDSNVLTVARDESRTLIWKSDHEDEDSSTYFFGLSCDGNHVVVARNHDFYNNPVVWSQPTIPDPNPVKIPTMTVLRSGEVKDVESRGTNPRCWYLLQGDGVITVRRNYRFGFTEAVWSSSPAKWPEEVYQYRLNDMNGSIEVFYKKDGEDKIFYTSNNPPNLFPTNGDKTFELVMTPECVLEIIQDGEHLVWSSNRDEGLSSTGDFYLMQRGEMFHVDPCAGTGASCHQTLLLQLDCNLIQFEGVDPLDFWVNNRRVLWASGTLDPVPDNCYLHADHDNLRMYSGTFDWDAYPRGDPHAGNRVLWEADPGTFGGYRVGLGRLGGLESSTCPAV